MARKHVLSLVLAAFVPLAAWAGSTQTGTLRGTVFDSKGEPLVGVLVTLGSPSLIRERALVTDAQGAFFAAGLPPGDYKVTAKLDGYITMELSTNVEVDKTTPLSVTLKEGAVTETVTVTAERPVVDRTNTESSVVLEKTFTEQLPVPRSDLSLLTFAPGVVDADGDILRRVLQNLVDNAVRHGPVGSTVRVEGGPAADGSLELRVIDQGAGIPPELRQRIFDRYARIEGADQPRGHARHGLGLAFCRLAVENHGGSISVEPNQPRGSVFVVRLPGGDRVTGRVAAG